MIIHIADKRSERPSLFVLLFQEVCAVLFTYSTRRCMAGKVPTQM